VDLAESSDRYRNVTRGAEFREDNFERRGEREVDGREKRTFAHQVRRIGRSCAYYLGGWLRLRPGRIKNSLRMFMTLNKVSCSAVPHMRNRVNRHCRRGGKAPIYWYVATLFICSLAYLFCRITASSCEFVAESPVYQADANRKWRWSRLAIKRFCCNAKR
jgi:hypothetical protein